MRENIAKKRLYAGETLYGIFANAISPELIEIMGITGFDFIVVDSEHSSSGPESNRILNMAGECRGASMFTRIPNKLDSTVLRHCDAGAQGLLVPQVNTKEEAESIVRAAKYYPEGMRGFTMPRNADYGFCKGDYVVHNNENMLIAVQCENVAGVPNVGEIAAVDGVDVIFIGPMDLTESMGIVGQTQDPRVKEVIDIVLEETKKHHKYAGIFAMSPEQAKEYAKMGFRYIICCTDLMLFGRACEQTVKALKGE